MEDLGFEGTSKSYTAADAMKVDYKVLHKEYMDNPIAADEKYKGKILELTGPIDTIDREIAGNPYVTFEIELLEMLELLLKNLKKVR